MVVSPPTSVAFVAMPSGEGGETSVQSIHEGDVVDGYRVISIEVAGITFERDGERFMVKLGSDREAVSEAPVALPPPVSESVSEDDEQSVIGIPARQAESRPDRPAELVAPPANLKEVRQATRRFLERLQESPEFRQKLDALRPQGPQRPE